MFNAIHTLLDNLTEVVDICHEFKFGDTEYSDSFITLLTKISVNLEVSYDYYITLNSWDI